MGRKTALCCLRSVQLHTPHIVPSNLTASTCRQAAHKQQDHTEQERERCRTRTQTSISHPNAITHKHQKNFQTALLLQNAVTQNINTVRNTMRQTERPSNCGGQSTTVKDWCRHATAVSLKREAQPPFQFVLRVSRVRVTEHERQKRRKRPPSALCTTFERRQLRTSLSGLLFLSCVHVPCCA